MRLQLSSKYGEYDALMRFLTETGMDFLEMIDLREIHFSNLLESVYKKQTPLISKMFYSS